MLFIGTSPFYIALKNAQDFQFLQFYLLTWGMGNPVGVKFAFIVVLTSVSLIISHQLFTFLPVSLYFLWRNVYLSSLIILRSYFLFLVSS